MVILFICFGTKHKFVYLVILQLRKYSLMTLSLYFELVIISCFILKSVVAVLYKLFYFLFLFTFPPFFPPLCTFFPPAVYQTITCLCLPSRCFSDGVFGFAIIKLSRQFLVLDFLYCTLLFACFSWMLTSSLWFVDGHTYPTSAGK